MIAGAMWAGAPATHTAALMMAACAVALTAYANVVNDLCDVEIDAVSHPDRPLARGDVTNTAAIALAATAAAIAILLATRVSAPIALSTLGVLAAMTLYSTHLKRAGLPGNLLVAFLGSLPFLYGAWAVADPRAAFPLLAAAIPLHFAREVAKDLADARGDAPTRRTLPLTIGSTASRAVAAIAMFLGLFAIAWLATTFKTVGLYLIPSAILVVAALIRMTGRRADASPLLKWAMAAAVIAIVLSRI